MKIIAFFIALMLALPAAATAVNTAFATDPIILSRAATGLDPFTSTAHKATTQFVCIFDQWTWMAAFDTSNSTWYYWKSCGPDTLGLGSGRVLSNLSHIRAILPSSK